jgi:hypothetical protein
MPIRRWRWLHRLAAVSVRRGCVLVAHAPSPLLRRLPHSGRRDSYALAVMPSPASAVCRCWWMSESSSST